MDKRRWDLVIPIITIFLLLFAIILVLIKSAHDEMTKEVVTTEATTEAEIATASVATPEEAMIEPEPTKEVVHCVTTEQTSTQEETTEEVTTEVFSATVEEITTLAVTEAETEEVTEEPTTEEYIEPQEPEEPAPPEEPSEPEAPVEETAESNMTYLGTYYITGYTATGSACANGNYPTSGYTCASNSLPMGTVIYIEGIGTRVVEDRGGMASNVIDVFVDSTSEAYALTGSYNVYLVE